MPQRDFVKRFRRKGARTRALTGRGPSPQELEAVTRGEIGARLDVSLREQVAGEQIRRSKEASELERQRLEQEAGAAKISGAIGVGELGLGLAESETVRGLAGKVAETGIGKAVTGAAARTAESLGITAAKEVGASELAAKELAGLGVEEAAATGAPSAGGVAAPALIGAQVGRAVGKTDVFQAISPFGGEKTESIFGAALGGFIATGFNPLGAVFGLVSGAAQEATVICTELTEQGYLDPYVNMLDGMYREQYIDDNAYAGYMAWAPTVVKWMKKSRIVTQIVRPFGVGWAHHMAHQLDNKVKDSKLGWFLLKVGVPTCRKIGERNARILRECR